MLRGDTKTATYETRPGKLIRGGVKVTDFNQNHLGDCWFAAGASAVAHRNPELVKKAFTQNKDHTVSVHLYDQDGSGRLKPQTVTVDRTLPVRGGETIYGDGKTTPRGGDELWPGLIEKGAAKMRGGYAKIENDSIGAGMAVITGKPSREYDLKPNQGARTYKMIKNAAQAGHPMTAGTPSDKDFALRTKALAAHDPNDPYLKMLKTATGSTHKLDGTGVWTDHTYTVLGVSQKNGVKQVALRNPWGSGEPPKAGFGTGPANMGGDGVFKLPIGVFINTFDSLAVGGTTAVKK
jgi:hypothetical protein